MCTNCTLFLLNAMPWCYLCSTFVRNQIVLTTMKRMLNRMLRYADAIVKRGVDKLIDAIGQTPEPQAKNTETPQPQKRMDNDTDCAPQAIGNTTNCGLTEHTITLMDELCNIHYNVLDRTPEVQRRDLAGKGLVSVSKPYLRPLKNPTRDASPPLVLALFPDFITFCAIEWRILKTSELRL